MQKVNELPTFHFVFQMSRKIVFEVNYYRLGNNKNKYFTTSACQFNQPKTDYNHCGQAQNELLKGFTRAMNFYKDFDKYHLKDLTPDQHTEILSRIEVLKEKYNFIETRGESRFSEVRALTMQAPKKLKPTTQPE